MTYTAATPSPGLPQKRSRVEASARLLNDAVQAVSAKDQSSGSEPSGEMGRLFFRRPQPTAVTGGPGAPEFDRRDVTRGLLHLDCCARLHLSMEKGTTECSPVPACACQR